MKIHWIIAPICALLVLGCDSKPKPQAKEEKVKGGVFQPQLDALEKAKGVEKTLQKQAEELQKKIDEQEKK